MSLPFYGVEQYNQNIKVVSDHAQALLTSSFLIGQKWKTTSIREVPNMDGLPFFVQEVMRSDRFHPQGSWKSVKASLEDNMMQVPDQRRQLIHSLSCFY